MELHYHAVAICGIPQAFLAGGLIHCHGKASHVLTRHVLLSFLKQRTAHCPIRLQNVW